MPVEGVRGKMVGVFSRGLRSGAIRESREFSESFRRRGPRSEDELA